MTKTIDNLNQKKNRHVENLEKLLLRAQLDRPQILNEKFYCIWRETPNKNTAEQKEERMRSTMRLLGNVPS